MNRRLTALALALAVLIVLLSGCITLPRYEWYVDPNQGPMDYYRWVVVERSTMPYVCGFLPAEHGACAVRLNQGMLKPTDKPLRPGLPAPSGDGKLCVIQATASEEDAKRMSDQFYESTLWAHEVLKHCAQGLDHKLIPGRIG